MKVLAIEENRARCAALGQERWADLMLMPEGGVSIGDHVIIHLGFVQRTVPESEAAESISLFKDILEKLPDGDPQTTT